MLKARIKMKDERVAGINKRYYAFFDNVFNDVFMNDLRGVFRSRLEEYIERMLFVLGGNDPIVSTNSVMSLAPETGVNAIEIAKLGHYPWSDIAEWREFWLPSVGMIIKDFALRTETKLAETLKRNWWSRNREKLEQWE